MAMAAAPLRDVKTVCVTGAAGYIASWIVNKLLVKGYKVRGAVLDPGAFWLQDALGASRNRWICTEDEGTCCHLRQLEGAGERLALLKADVRDYESVSEAIRGCDCVFHTACPVQMSFEKPDDVLVPAVLGTENVMRACYQHGVKRVVMTSSNGAVLHDPKRASDKVVDESCWSDGDYCLEHKDYYFAAKTKSEELAWKMAKEHNLDLVVICPAMVLGPLLQHTLNTSLLILKRLVDGSKSTYPHKYVDLVDVRDTAEVHLLAYENPDASGRYYCVSQVVTYKDIVEVLKKHFPDLYYPESCESETPAGIPPAKVSNRKTQGLIKNFIPLESMLVDAIQSLREHDLLLL